MLLVIEIMNIMVLRVWSFFVDIDRVGVFKGCWLDVNNIIIFGCEICELFKMLVVIFKVLFILWGLFKDVMLFIMLLKEGRLLLLFKFIFSCEFEL